MVKYGHKYNNYNNISNILLIILLFSCSLPPSGYVKKLIVVM